MFNNNERNVVEDAPAVVAPNEDHNGAQENDVIPPVAGQNAQNAIIPLVAAVNHYLTAMPTFAEPPQGMDVQLNVANFSDEMDVYGLGPFVAPLHEWEAFAAIDLQTPFNAVDDAQMAFMPFDGPIDAQVDLEASISDSESEEEDANEEMEVEQMLE